MVNMYEVKNNKDQKIYSLDDLINLYDYEEDQYNKVCKDLCCPSCGEQNIVIKIDLDVATIKSKRNSHKEWCDYYGFKVSQGDMKKRIKQKVGFEDLINARGKKLIPKRSLERTLQEDDIDVYKLFYGDVLVKEAHTKNKDKYINFSIKAPLGDAIVISIQTKHLTNKLEKVLNDNIDKTMHMRVIGKIVEVDQYKNLLLEHTNFFLLD